MKPPRSKLWGIARLRLCLEKPSDTLLKIASIFIRGGEPRLMSYCWRTQKCRKLCIPHGILEGKKAWKTYARKSTARTLKLGRLRARSILAFSPSPPPNRTGYLSHHPALRFPCFFDFGLLFAAVLDNVEDRVGCSHLAYLDVLSMGNLPHFALGLL